MFNYDYITKYNNAVNINKKEQYMYSFQTLETIRPFGKKNLQRCYYTT